MNFEWFSVWISDPYNGQNYAETNLCGTSISTEIQRARLVDPEEDKFYKCLKEEGVTAPGKYYNTFMFHKMGN